MFVPFGAALVLLRVDGLRRSGYFLALNVVCNLLSPPAGLLWSLSHELGSRGHDLNRRRHPGHVLLHPLTCVFLHFAALHFRLS